ncbi:MAG: glcB, partial [Alphaproteobacteria bacterium]|nr:glcB [Alphaproteobacteria bacterium]
DPAGSPAFQAARALVLEGAAQPSGYTEPLLHAARLALKGEAPQAVEPVAVPA